MRWTTPSLLILLSTSSAVLVACSGSDASDPDTDTDTVVPSGTYAALDNWICHPDLAEASNGDVCTGDFALTDVEEDGSQTAVAHTIANDPPVDCFYVYPTASADSTLNADLAPRDEEELTTQLQAGRYSEVCRVFAPAYRQVTLLGIVGAGDYELAYGDVLDAFQRFRADAGDRPFLLLGHSQGSIHLTRLIAEEIETDPALADQLVSAHLLGGFVEVEAESAVGGSFASTPLCTSADQAGCVVHYVSFAADDPPGPTALFGRTPVPGREVACVNPSALLAGTPDAEVDLTGAFPTELPPDFLSQTSSPYAEPADHPPIDTPYFGLPGFVRGACIAEDGASYLGITLQPDPSDPRTDELDVEFLPGWGLHLVDFNVAQRDLVELARRQIQAYGG